MSTSYLVADKREREVIPHLTPIMGGRLVQSQIHTGDYLICRKAPDSPETQVIACIERKSLADFASSLRDGRYENRKKMLELRDATGCQLWYIVEGPAFCSPERSIGSHTKYKSILSAMISLPLCSGIMVMQTRDTQYTAERLRDMVMYLDKVPDPYLFPIAEGDTTASKLCKEGTLVPELVTGSYEKDPDHLCMEIWAQLRGITITTAKILAETCSIAEFLLGQPFDIGSFKTATGRTLVKDGRESLKNLKNGDTSMAIRILTGVTDISNNIARDILLAIPQRTHKLHALCQYNSSSLAQVELKQKSRTVKLGEKRATKILKMMYWKSGAVQGLAPTQGHVLGGAPAPGPQPGAGAQPGPAPPLVPVGGQIAPGGHPGAPPPLRTAFPGQGHVLGGAAPSFQEMMQKHMQKMGGQ